MVSFREIKISDIRVIEDDREKSIAKNLAIEEAIFEMVNSCESPNTFRVWIAEKSAIAPFHESIFDVIDVKYCLDNNIKLNRRITGGGAIYCDEGNLNWSFYFKREPFEKLSVLDLYKYFGEIILEAVKSIGVKAKLFGENWLGIEGKKISGMAGYIKKNAILIHGTLLVFSDLVTLGYVCKLHYKYPPVTNVSNYRSVSVWDVKDVVAETVYRKFKGFTGDLTDKEKSLAEKLKKEKYDTFDWIFMK